MPTRIFFVFSESRTSDEETQLFIQGGVCKRLQQIPPGRGRRPVHRLQPQRGPDQTEEEQTPGSTAPVSPLHEGNTRLRHKPSQLAARGRSASKVHTAPA